MGKNSSSRLKQKDVILERLIAYRLRKEYGEIWRGGNRKIEKDIVNTTNDYFSFEIKTSSSKNGLFGNRSVGNKSIDSKKDRTGYYLVINYKLPTEEDPSRHLYKIRFGWLDDADWVGQKTSGQQASVPPTVSKGKLLVIYQS